MRRDRGISERERIELFEARVRELAGTYLVRSGGLNVSFSISGEFQQPTKVEFSYPDGEPLRSFLMTFRQFVSPNEPIHVDRVANLCLRELGGGWLAEQLGKARRAYQAERRVGTMSLSINGQHMEPAHLLDLWLNGVYFHNDVTKRAELQRHTGIDGQLMRHNYLNLVVETTRFVVFVRNVVVLGLNEGLIHI